MCVAKDFMWLKEKEKSTVCSNETMKGPVKGRLSQWDWISVILTTRWQQREEGGLPDVTADGPLMILHTQTHKHTQTEEMLEKVMKDAAEPKAGATGTQILDILFFKYILFHFMASVLISIFFLILISFIKWINFFL